MADPVITDPWDGLKRFTPARIALGRCGDSLPTTALLDFGVAHAAARDAVHHRLDVPALKGALQKLAPEVLVVQSAASERSVYLRRPDLGRRLSDASRLLLAENKPAGPIDLVLVIADGLSAFAPERHAVPLLEALMPLLSATNFAPPVIALEARVALGDEIGEIWGAQFVAVLIGERPGLSSPDSLGVYLTYQPRVGRSDAERNCISNIRPEGLDYARAAGKLAYLIQGALRLGATGVGLKDESEGPPAVVIANPNSELDSD
jgi:ethanolamine ammonia-lyase small subunit